MRLRACYFLLGIFFFAGVIANAQDTLVIAGTGDSQALLRRLGPIFEKGHPGTTIEVPDSVGSGGGIKAVSRKEAGLGRTARPLKEKEKPGLSEVVFARSPVVFATNASVQGVKGLSQEQILAIYSGKITNWKDVGGPDAKIYPISREDGDSSRETINNNLPGFRELSLVSKEFFTTGETAEAIQNHNHTIGYLPLSMAIDYGLNPLTIDGKVADAEHVNNDSYPYVTSLYLVKNATPSPLAEQFIEFLLNDEVSSLMLKQGVLPVKKARQ